jgi:hypothetical protein
MIILSGFTKVYERIHTTRREMVFDPEQIRVGLMFKIKTPRQERERGARLVAQRGKKEGQGIGPLLKEWALALCSNCCPTLFHSDPPRINIS